MSTLAYILIFSFLSSIASLIGGVILLGRKKLADNLLHLLAAFAAGTLLGTAFFDLLPEALVQHADPNILSWALLGIIGFFLLERFINWFHHHHEHDSSVGRSKPVVPLVILGDTIHNFIDGLVVGGAFMVDVRLGVVTALATAAHEIPQEIGDFSILLSQGVPKAKVFVYNLLSSFSTIVGALLVYFAAGSLAGLLPVFLSVTAGFFIYIAASDLIPEIHGQDKKGFAFWESALLVGGAGVVWLAIKLLEG